MLKTQLITDIRINTITPLLFNNTFKINIKPYYNKNFQLCILYFCNYSNNNLKNFFNDFSFPSYCRYSYVHINNYNITIVPHYDSKNFLRIDY